MTIFCFVFLFLSFYLKLKVYFKNEVRTNGRKPRATSLEIKKQLKTQTQTNQIQPPQVDFFKFQEMFLPILLPNNGDQSYMLSNFLMNLLTWSRCWLQREAICSHAVLPWSNIDSYINCSTMEWDRSIWLKTSSLLHSQQSRL